MLFQGPLRQLTRAISCLYTLLDIWYPYNQVLIFWAPNLDAHPHFFLSISEETTIVLEQKELCPIVHSWLETRILKKGTIPPIFSITMWAWKGCVFLSVPCCHRGTKIEKKWGISPFFKIVVSRYKTPFFSGWNRPMLSYLPTTWCCWIPACHVTTSMLCKK